MKHIIDCSRRHDIIAENPSAFYKRLENGSVWVSSPSNPAHKKLLLFAESAFIRLWSKDYSKLIQLEQSSPILSEQDRIRYVFRFNGVGGRESQPWDMAWDIARIQLKELTEIAFAPDHVILDYSPIYMWVPYGDLESTSVYFEETIEHAASLGITKCMYAFLNSNDKINLVNFLGDNLCITGISEKIQGIIENHLQTAADKYGVELFPRAQKEQWTYDIGNDL